jgi:hypothetical protein
MHIEDSELLTLYVLKNMGQRHRSASVQEKLLKIFSNIMCCLLIIYFYFLVFMLCTPQTTKPFLEIRIRGTLHVIR